MSLSNSVHQLLNWLVIVAVASVVPYLAGRGGRKRRAPDPYLADEEDEEPPVDDRPDPYEDTPAPKRARADDPVTRPRLGQAGFSVTTYITRYSGDVLDAFRFSLLRAGVGEAKTVTYQIGDRTMKSTTRYGAWRERWQHVGNRVKAWVATGLDMIWFRSAEERDLIGAMANFITTARAGLATQNFLEVPILDFYPALTDLDCFTTAWRWVREHRFEARMRTRYATGRNTTQSNNRIDPDIFVG